MSEGKSISWNQQHLEVVRRGPDAIRRFRGGSEPVGFELRGASLRDANLHSADLRGADLRRADLRRADLRDANLGGANLRHADLCSADLTRANLCKANLREADLSRADLRHANFSEGDLRRANLTAADLGYTNLRDADLSHADLTAAELRGTDVNGANLHCLFGRTVIEADLTLGKGLEGAIHSAVSFISWPLLLRSTQRPWPTSFLRGCGLSDFEIEHVRGIATTPIEFFSGFISYSSKDDAFAVKLHDALQAKGIRCWLDKHEVLPGDKVRAKVNEGIQLWDKVLLCCSEAALRDSWWVGEEIETALEKERNLKKDRGKDVLSIIPLDLDGFLFGDACQIEHAPTLRARHAPAFKGWDGDEKIFDQQLERVVKAMRADDMARPKPPAPKL